MGKTEVTKCGDGLQKVVDPESSLVGCVVNVNANSIQCTSCMKWIHKRCSGISRRCRGFQMQDVYQGDQGSNKSEEFVELDNGSKFELPDKFCYLWDMLCARGSRGTVSLGKV